MMHHSDEREAREQSKAIASERMVFRACIRTIASSTSTTGCRPKAKDSSGRSSGNKRSKTSKEGIIRQEPHLATTFPRLPFSIIPQIYHIPNRIRFVGSISISLGPSDSFFFSSDEVSPEAFLSSSSHPAGSWARARFDAK